MTISACAIQTCVDLRKQIAEPHCRVIRRYSNRPDPLEQLRKVAVILSDGGQDDGAGV